MNEELESGKDYGTVELLFSCEDEIETKTAWNGEDVIWTAGDMIAVTYLASGKWASEIATSEALDEDCKKALFCVPVSLAPSTGTMTFNAIYPSSCTDMTASSLPSVTINIPQRQTPSTNSFDRSADIMTAVSSGTYTGIPSSPIPLIWTRAVAHAEITFLSIPVAEGETPESIILTANEDADLTGQHTINLSTGKIDAVEDGNPKNIVTADASALSFDSEGNMRFQISVLPCTMSSLTVTVVTDAAEYSRTITEEITLKVDRRHTMAVDMSSAIRTVKPSAGQDELVNSRIFDILDLDTAGLEEVREAYEVGHLYSAAQALKTYWLGRTGIVNTEVNLDITKNTESDKNIADQALAENGYRFYVKNYSEKTENGQAVYYSFLGEDGGIDWDVTPVTETQFALQKHRHQWIEPQAKVYKVTGDEKYVKAIVDVYSDWLETYPCPGASTESYAIASGHPLRDMWTDLQATSRVMTYLNVLDYCLQAEAFTPEFLTHLLVSLYDTVESIRANLYHTAASNHRLFEVQAIYNAAVLLPEFASASSWESESYTALAEQRDIQFAEDGVQNEMDPGYHISVVSQFYQMYDLAKNNSRESMLPENYVSKLRNACMFVRDIIYPDYSLEDFNDVRSIGWSESVLVKNFTKYAELFPDEASFLWMAKKGGSGTAPEENFSAYKHSGWYMLRTGWSEDDMMLILKNNYNYDKWWHCQPDNCTISLYRKGRRFLPDAGVYSYGGSASDNATRDEFRATSTHNTMTYGGETIADGNMLGEFVSETHNDSYDKFSTKNQSYPAIRHQRTVFRMKEGGFFVVADAAIGSATGKEVALHWHFCPGEVKFERLTDSYRCTTGFEDGNNMSFRTFCFNGLSSDTGFVTSEGTSLTSSAIGQKTERPCCSVGLTKTDASTPIRFITVIFPVASASDLPEIEASFASASSVKLTVNGTVYNLSI
ncbi:MAG: heparinase II/III family protein [Candidatus Cryptobacteroides sp.]